MALVYLRKMQPEALDPCFYLGKNAAPTQPLAFDDAHLCCVHAVVLCAGMAPPPPPSSWRQTWPSFCELAGQQQTLCA
jgi:hypothetical protein